MKTAWILFKQYQMTFSQALIEGWKRVKKELLKIEFSKTTSDEVTYRAKLVRRYNEIKFEFFDVRQSIKDEWKRQHELSQQNTANYMEKFGYENWMH